MAPGTSSKATAAAVIAVLAGTPLHETAARASIAPADLADAVAVYHAAGQEALDAQAPVGASHHQKIIVIDDDVAFVSGFDLAGSRWDTAEHAAATHLGPPLQQSEAAGIISAWWFTRKIPCWRLRCRPGPGSSSSHTTSGATPRCRSAIA